MRSVKVRGVEIGSGRPKICIPIVAANREAIIREAKEVKEYPVDIIEWRVDWFEDALQIQAVKEVLIGLREAAGNTPLLFTFRTANEGGEKAIEAEAYFQLVLEAAKTGQVDLADIEAFQAADQTREWAARLRKEGVKVVLSNHDFDKTPSREMILARLKKMEELGADISKIAVMPQNKKDLLELLSATEEMSTDHAQGPIITMSMAGIGLPSRLMGEAFGSAVTFGSAGKSSAPGQMDARELDQVLEIIHKNI